MHEIIQRMDDYLEGFRDATEFLKKALASEQAYDDLMSRYTPKSVEEENFVRERFGLPLIDRK